jgi:hypothetical protein
MKFVSGLACTLICVPIIALASCARTKVANVTQTVSPVQQPPHTVAIIIDDASPPPSNPRFDDKRATDIHLVETGLAKSLSTLLTSHQLTVVNPDQAPDLTLHCTITQIHGGIKAVRLIVGMGLAKAVLDMKVSLLQSTVQAGAPSITGMELLTFDTHGTSGALPGTGASPGGLASAALASLMREGLSKEVEQSTKDIDQQLTTYFDAQHWPYPKPANVHGAVAVNSTSARSSS